MAATLAAIACASSAEAREASRPVDISAGTLAEAIAELSREARISIGTEGALPHLRTTAVRGQLTIAQALARLLAGSGLVARQVGGSAWRIERAPQPALRPDPRPVQHVPLPPLPPAPPIDDPVPIIVTATKRDEALANLPRAVSVVQFTGPDRANAAIGSARVASQLEGVDLTGLGPGRNRMFLRGVADSPFNGDSQSTVAILLDDARLTYSAPDPDLRMVDVERVEVLKGPQGSLYGTGAMGGVFHIVTRHADPGETSLTVAAAGEAVAQGGVGWSGSAVANLPLLRDKAALRLVGYAANEAGWVDTGSRKDSNSVHVRGGRAKLGVDAGDSWRLDLTGFVQRIEAQDSRYVYASGARSRPAQLPEPHDNHLRHIAARIARQDGPVKVLLSSAITWHGVTDTYDATIGGGALGSTNPSHVEDERQHRVWDTDLRLNGTIGGLTWLAGISHIESRQLETYHVYTFGVAGFQMLDDEIHSARDTAVYGDLGVPITGRLTLDVGARAYRSQSAEVLILPTGKGPHTSTHRSGVTPDASLSWRPREGRLLFVRYGQAFRQGGAEIESSGETTTLKSDDLKTVEAGWREQLPGGGHIELGAHFSWWRHMQSNSLEYDGTIETRNVGNSRLAGGDLSLDLPLGGRWRLCAGAAYDKANMDQNALGDEVAARRLPVVPKFTMRAALHRDFSLGRADGNVRLQVRYLGPARLSFDPLLDQKIGNVLETRIEGHLALDGFDLGIAVENLFNRKADLFAFGNPLRLATMRQYTPQRPRALSLSVMRSF